LLPWWSLLLPLQLWLWSLPWWSLLLRLQLRLLSLGCGCCSSRFSSSIRLLAATGSNSFAPGSRSAASIGSAGGPLALASCQQVLLIRVHVCLVVGACVLLALLVVLLLV